MQPMNLFLVKRHVFDRNISTVMNCFIISYILINLNDTIVCTKDQRDMAIFKKKAKVNRYIEL